MSDIARFFDMDPLELTRENIDALIDHFRKARAQFNLGVKDAGATKKIRGAKPVVEVDLDALLSGSPK